MAAEPIVFELSAPAQAHGEEITKLVLRPVRGEDIAACGYPFTIKNMAALESGAAEPDIEFHGPAVAAMVSRLAGVPRSTVAALPGGDFFKLSLLMVQLFLAPAPPTSSNAASTSPGSGSSPPPTSLRSISSS